MIIEQPLQFGFQAINNEVEYEALIGGCPKSWSVVTPSWWSIELKENT